MLSIRSQSISHSLFAKTYIPDVRIVRELSWREEVARGEKRERLGVKIGNSKVVKTYNRLLKQVK